MFLAALRGALSRRRWASEFIIRNRPFARPISPSEAPLTEKSSKIGTGSGLDHSPSVHALYQPTEPEVARRTRAIQLAKFSTAVAPGPRKPRSRFDPSGSVRCIPPTSSLRSISSRTLEKAGAARRASVPPPVAKRRSARKRCSPRVLMPRELWLRIAVVETDEEVGARGTAGFEEALVGQIGMAALELNHRHARPEEEGANMLVAFRRLGEPRIVEVERNDLRIEPQVIEPIEEVVGAKAPDTPAAPDHLALPELKRDFAGDDHVRLRDPGDERTSERLGAEADRGVEADVTEHCAEGPHRGPSPVLSKPLCAPRHFEAEDQRDPDPGIEDEQGVAVEPTVRDRIEQPGAVGVHEIEQRVAQGAEKTDQQKRAQLDRAFLAGPKPFPQQNDCRCQERHGDEPTDAVSKPAMLGDRHRSEQRRDEAVDVGQVGRQDQRGHGARSQALQTHAPHDGADQAVREVVQSAAADQSLCGSFSTIQVWPLETSACRSAALPFAAAAFCSMTAASKVAAGFS